MRRTNILRGLVSLVSTVLVFAIIMTKTAFSFQPIINSTLNTKKVELVSLDEGADAKMCIRDSIDSVNVKGKQGITAVGITLPPKVRPKAGKTAKASQTAKNGRKRKAEPISA